MIAEKRIGISIYTGRRLINVVSLFFGAPDFVLEVISSSSRKKDMKLKRDKYENAGVREYWVLDPYKQKLVVYDFEGDTLQRIYGLDQPVPVNIYGGRLVIQMDRIGVWVSTKIP